MGAETLAERKARYVSDILKAHPIYLAETHISQEAGKYIGKLPEQPLFWLWHMAKGTQASAGQLLMQAEGYEDLWLCHETIRDGENEYGCEFFVKAKNEDEAEILAWTYVRDNYRYDMEELTKPFKDCLNENGWMELDGDYRWVQAYVIRKITCLKDILDRIGCVTYGIEGTPEGKLAAKS